MAILISSDRSRRFSCTITDRRKSDGHLVWEPGRRSGFCRDCLQILQCRICFRSLVGIALSLSAICNWQEAAAPIICACQSQSGKCSESITSTHWASLGLIEPYWTASSENDRFLRLNARSSLCSIYERSHNGRVSSSWDQFDTEFSDKHGRTAGLYAAKICSGQSFETILRNLRLGEQKFVW